MLEYFLPMKKGGINLGKMHAGFFWSIWYPVLGRGGGLEIEFGGEE